MVVRAGIPTGLRASDTDRESTTRRDSLSDHTRTPSSPVRSSMQRPRSSRSSDDERPSSVPQRRICSRSRTPCPNRPSNKAERGSLFLVIAEVSFQLSPAFATTNRSSRNETRISWRHPSTEAEPGVSGTLASGSGSRARTALLTRWRTAQLLIVCAMSRTGLIPRVHFHSRDTSTSVRSAFMRGPSLRALRLVVDRDTVSDGEALEVLLGFAHHDAVEVITTDAEDGGLAPTNRRTQRRVRPRPRKPHDGRQ